MTAITLEVAGMIGGNRWLCHGQEKKYTVSRVAAEGVWFDPLKTVQEALDSKTQCPRFILSFFFLTLFDSHFVLLIIEYTNFSF